MSADLDPSFAAADAAAEAVAANLRAGGDPGADVRPSVDPLRGDELDKIFDEASANQPPEADPMADAKKASGIKDEPADEPAKEAAKDPVDPAKEAAKEPAKDEPKKNLLDSLLSEEKKETPAAEKDPYEEVKLRADASPKTRETFEALKATAREREKAALEKAAALEKTVAELSEKTKSFEGKTATPEVEAELKELRAFRAQFDTENDPEFKSKYSTKIEGNYEAIFNVLHKDNGLKIEVVNQLKAMSPAERDQHIESFLAKIPATSRRLIEAKLIENVSVQEQRAAELSSARAKADQILAERAAAPAQSAEKLQAEIAGHLRPVLGKLDWIQIKEAPATASPAEKAAIEKANEFAAFAQETLKNAIVDQSPRARAEAALAVPLAHHFKARASALETELAAVKKELEGIRRASQTSRTARTSANPTPAAAPKKEEPASGEDAVDALFREAGGIL